MPPSEHARNRNSALLAEAHRARNRGRDRRAISLYKRILLEDPHNPDVALRLAPMLARRGEGFEAWQIYRMVARDFAKAKQYAECLTVYREACRFVPWEFEAWRLSAELQLKMGREGPAFETLIDGRNQFRDANSRAQAIQLLSRARAIEPWEPHLVLDLARLYARTDQADIAVELLTCLALRVRGSLLRRVRTLQWRITLDPRYAFLWLRALHERDTEPGPLEEDSLRRLRVGSPYS